MDSGQADASSGSSGSEEEEQQAPSRRVTRGAVQQKPAPAAPRGRGAGPAARGGQTGPQDRSRKTKPAPARSASRSGESSGSSSEESDGEDGSEQDESESSASSDDSSDDQDYTVRRSGTHRKAAAASAQGGPHAAPGPKARQRPSGPRAPRSRKRPGAAEAAPRRGSSHPSLASLSEKAGAGAGGRALDGPGAAALPSLPADAPSCTVEVTDEDLHTVVVPGTAFADLLGAYHILRAFSWQLKLSPFSLQVRGRAGAWARGQEAQPPRAARRARRRGRRRAAGGAAGVRRGAGAPARRTGTRRRGVDRGF